VSRDNVQVELRARKSTSPDCSAVETLLRAQRLYSTLLGSPSTGGRDRLAEIDIQTGPDALIVRAPNPAKPVVTPHFTFPAAFTPSSVEAAWAAVDIPAISATPATKVFRWFIGSNVLP